MKPAASCGIPGSLGPSSCASATMRSAAMGSLPRVGQISPRPTCAAAWPTKRTPAACSRAATAALAASPKAASGLCSGETIVSSRSPAPSGRLGRHQRKLVHGQRPRRPRCDDKRERARGALLDVREQPLEHGRVAIEALHLLVRGTRPSAQREQQAVVADSRPAGAAHEPRIDVDGHDAVVDELAPVTRHELREPPARCARAAERLPDGQRLEDDAISGRDERQPQLAGAEVMQRKHGLQRSDAAAGDDDVTRLDHVNVLQAGVCDGSSRLARSGQGSMSRTLQRAVPAAIRNRPSGIGGNYGGCAEQGAVEELDDAALSTAGRAERPPRATPPPASR